MARLATFVHASDLHFGTLDPSSLDAANPWWMRLPKLDGFLGHSEWAITQLSRRFTELKKSEGAGLIITGDLTTCGKASEFQLFDIFAGANPSAKSLNYLGLRTADWKKTSIPGNHDHWPGTLAIFGAPEATLYQFFSDLPRVTPVLYLPLGYKLRFIWIDSDIDVGFKAPNRGWARGSFVSHLEIVKQKLLEGSELALSEKEIRVLCLHHSPTFSRKVYPGALEIDRRSRERLNRFIVECRISVVLCGHIHTPPYVQPELASHSDGKALFLEARCGSTTQARLSDLLPSLKSKLRSLGILPNEETNSLLVHRIVEESGKVYWETEINLLYPGLFVKPTAPALPNGQTVTVRFRVWP